MDDPSAHQLETWEKDHPIPQIARNPSGAPHQNLTSTLTLGPTGPPLLQDTTYLELLQSFVRKNTPVRVVHGKGSGAHGYFQLINPDISKYSRACIFQNTSQKIDLFARFGTPDEEGRPDSSRVFWTMSLKLYTEEGNQDILCFNLPVFHIRDPLDFINFHQSAFANPQTCCGFVDFTAVWDYVLSSPEAVHFYTLLFSDRGLPLSFRHINAFPINTFKLINTQGDYFYARFQIKTNQGVRYLTNEEASEVRKRDPFFAARDLYNAIARGDYPSFTWYVQIMEKDEIPKFIARTGWIPFDNTKIWPQKEFPLVEIGQIILNRNMDNFFNESILSAFNPANLIPGIEPAPQDKIFHGRIFAYDDAQRYRLGNGKNNIPINREKVKGQPISRGGCPFNLEKKTLNRFNAQKNDESQKLEGFLNRYDHTQNDNFSQPKQFYEIVISQDEKERLAENLAEGIILAGEEIQKKVIQLFSNVSLDLAQRTMVALNKLKNQYFDNI